MGILSTRTFKALGTEWIGEGFNGYHQVEVTDTPSLLGKWCGKTEQARVFRCETGALGFWRRRDNGKHANSYLEWQITTYLRKTFPDKFGLES